MAAERCFAGDHDQNGGDDQPVEDRQDNLTADFGIGDGCKLPGHLDAHGLHELLGDAAADFHGAQRGDERGNLAAGNEEAVDISDQAAHEERGQNPENKRGNAGDADGGEQAVRIAVDEHHHDRADRDQGRAHSQINAA